MAKVIGSISTSMEILILVPTDEDDMKFHLSIEEYLHSLISLINELVRDLDAELMSGSTCCQFCYDGRLRASFGHQSICQGLGERISITKSKK